MKGRAQNVVHPAVGVPTLAALLGMLLVWVGADTPTGVPDTVQLTVPATAKFIDYAQYGEFRNVGTDKYLYAIKDRKGLTAVCPEGVDPNRAVFANPVLKQLRESGQLKGPHWNFTDHVRKTLRYYAWADAKEDAGVRQYYIAKALEENGHLLNAIQAYYSVLVLYPRTVGWSYWGSPLYMSRMALDRIQFLTRAHPELGISLEGAFVRVENGFDDDTSNDRVLVHPGRWALQAPASRPVDLAGERVVKTVGGTSTQLVQYENGHWQLLKDGKPFVIRAMAYTPTPVGVGSKTPGYEVNGTWQTADRNNNGLVDGVEECWVDKNRNNYRDADEPMTSDMELMQRLGVNTVRIYHHVRNKELLRKWHAKYGTMFLMGDFAGAYAFGSGVDFETGTDYNNPEQQARILEGLRQMVLDQKDEPYVLMWVLGNENVYGSGSNAKKDPVAFFKFLNRAAQLIHELDPTRPVAVSSGDLYRFDLFVEHAPAVDVYGCNIYRGGGGMGDSFWKTVREVSGKPVLITEYGNSAYGKDRSEAEIEVFHRDYHQGNWEDIARNLGGGPGEGNALGGVAFEYCDEWWKAELFSQKDHDAQPQHPAPYCDGNNYEEWYGFYSLGNGQDSPFLRQPRLVVDYYTQAWNRP